MLNEQERYERAKKQVNRIKKFYKHMTSWLITSAFLFVLFFFLRIPPMVSLIVIGGWGLAIIAEAIDVFGFPGFDRDWEEKKIREEIQRMERMEMESSERPANRSEETTEDSLELKEYEKMKRNWKDTDFV